MERQPLAHGAAAPSTWGDTLARGAARLARQVGLLDDVVVGDGEMARLAARHAHECEVLEELAAERAWYTGGHALVCAWSMWHGMPVSVSM